MAATPFEARDEVLILDMTAAVDTDCDGDLGDETVADALFHTSKSLVPGECLIYRADYRNDGDFAIRKVILRTPVPRFMSYIAETARHVATPPGLWPAAPHPPLDGRAGDMVWRFHGGLAPGEAGRVEFRVRLVP